MTCVYTGARILVVEYGFIAPADLYRVGNSIIARFNVHGKQWAETQEHIDQATHKIFCNPECWFREDIGVIVVPRKQCEGSLTRATHWKGDVA